MKWHSGINILLNRAAPKICMAGRNCDKAIKAHSISRARILSKLAEQGKVVTVAPGDTPQTVAFELRGTGQVATFSGFCSIHDQELFAPIDSADYGLYDSKQQFLFAYRTLAQDLWFSLMERYASEARARTAEDILSGKLKANATLEQIHQLAQDLNLAKDRSAKRSVALRDLKDRMNRNIGRRNYDEVATRIFVFPNEYPVAFSGPIYLRHGRSSEQSVLDPHIVTLNVFPQSGRTYALLTCPDREHELYLDQMLDTYRVYGITDNRVVLSHLICSTGDALAIRPSYWEMLPDGNRESFMDRWNDSLRARFNLEDPYDNSLNIFVAEALA